MVVFLSMNGKAQIITAENVFQGSNGVNTVNVITNIANLSYLTVGWELPDGKPLMFENEQSGLKTPYLPMAYVRQSDQLGVTTYSWTIKLKRNVTNMAGVVRMSFNAIDRNGNGTSFMAPFTVQESNLPPLPSPDEDSTDPYDLVLLYLRDHEMRIQDLEEAMDNKADKDLGNVSDEDFRRKADEAGLAWANLENVLNGVFKEKGRLAGLVPKETIDDIISGITKVGHALKADNFNESGGTIKQALDDLKQLINSTVSGLIAIGQVDVPTGDITQQILTDFAAQQGYPEPIQGLLIYDSENGKWAYNGTAWVYLGGESLNLASNTMFGMVRGDEINVSIIDGIITVLKAADAETIGGLPPETFMTLEKVKELISQHNIDKEAHPYILELLKQTVGKITYGIRIDKNNSNPFTSVVYTDDATDFIPSSCNNGNFYVGSWEDIWPFNAIKPCLFKDGAVVGYLNPNDYGKWADGHLPDPDITSGEAGDVMIEYPKIYTLFEQDDNFYYLKFSTGRLGQYDDWAYSYNGVIKDKFYIAAYLGWRDTNGKLRSLSGKIPYLFSEMLSETNQALFRTAAHENGEGYESIPFNKYLLLQALYILRFKNLQSSSAVGTGYFDGFSIVSDNLTTTPSPTGTTDNKGLNFGTLSINNHIKINGIEDLYGVNRCFIEGIIASNASSTFYYMVSDGNFNNTGNNYSTVATNGNVSAGFISVVKWTPLLGFLKESSSKIGSTSTYFCNYMNSSVATISMPFVGWSGASNHIYEGIFSTGGTYHFNTYKGCARLSFCG